MPQCLVLEFLGLPHVKVDNEPIATDRRKAIALLAYLAVNDLTHLHQRYSRESLSALLWPDYDQSHAFSNLRRTIWEVHQALGEGWLIAERESVHLNEDAQIDLDVARFLDLISQGRQQTDPALRIPLLSDAVKLYRNHFLTGFSLKDALNFNEWAFAESENLRRQLADALTILSDAYCELSQADKAIPHARRLVALDPLNESAHRQLMEVYLQAGQHSAALKQYQTCEQILRKELNLDPQPETRALYRRIRKGGIKEVQAEKPIETITPKHNLPLQLSTFIGREKEQVEIISLIAKHRLVTLAGTGGIGKTRLSLQVGQNLLNHYPGGVWFIAFDSLSDAALVPQTVAAIFDIQESADGSLVERLTDYLHEKTTLLIFDNCEHLLEACVDLITALLRKCPTLKILVTSRETLNVSGEAIYYMPSLSIPEGEVTIEKLPEYESIRLFTERAALAFSSFTLTKENAQTVVEICGKVDGIPLAIELAAARVNILQGEEILRQLHDSFALLSSDSRTILPRQQTLEASVDWSWGLLTESEQIFLRQLSVFAGGWTLESAQAVCNGEASLTGVALINALVKKSLIVVEQETGRETRFRFHEMVRQFAHEKLIQSGEEEKIRTLHLNYFLNLSTQAQLELRGPSRVDWTERLNDERNNLRAALHWAERTNVEAGLFLSGRLLRYWESSDLHEGIQWLDLFLHKEANEFPHARAYALYTYGTLLVWLQNFDHARLVAKECLKRFQEAGDRAGEVDALLLLGNTFVFTEELAAASKFGEQALTLSRSLHDPWREANSLYYLGWMTRDYDRMFPFWEKAIAVYRKLGDQVSLAVALGWLGQFRVLNGDFELAETYLDEALQLWQSNKRANIWDNPKIAKSLIVFARGDYEQAYTMQQEVLVSAEETGNRMMKLWAQVRLGYVALRSGNLAEAHHFFRETASEFGKDGFTIGTVFALEGMAGLYVTLNKPEYAARLIGWADAMRVKVDNPRPKIEQADVDQIIAACLVKMGEAEFSDLYDEGKLMTLDEGVALAL